MIKTKTELKKPTWLKYTKEEVVAIVKKLAEKDITSEKIGLILRDQYGIPSVRLYGIKMKEAMEDKFQEPTTLNLDKKLKKIIDHFKKNKQDKKSERALVITKAKLKKRTDYIKK
jgi:small subunit ribosomal protein S15